ncbi:MAG: DNA polymerase III subunit alpha [Lachnospiraceae bacterium]|uniref:DNA-directed DNA polymerase n=1 Tax=Candidatus Weimeria bifida TaxID=2599074 RepID=A0A6N7J109_9FIRM|nr:DNA polymerase III subunit alpha [Candidatus Weimeria bifida]RRF97341.1 MAG: DNA polymerase III subunit alpha [Lachnospiraceae bacterium]
MSFVHLHTHTQYSILDASNKIDNYIQRLKDLGMTAGAITDHGNMYGAIEFYQKAMKAGIKPIIGCEMYVATGSRLDKSSQKGDTRYYHLVLLCENMTGYKNLIKLVSIGNTEGFYFKPRIDHECLEKYHEGLICLSACIAGEVAQAAQISYEKAKEVALWHDKVFGRGNYFLEMQDHRDGSLLQRVTNQTVIKIHKETKIPLVITNDCHYTLPEDAASHDILLCMQENKLVTDEDRIRYEGGQYYVKSEDEIRELFPGFEDAIENTAKIADRCDVRFEFNVYKKPSYSLPKGHENETALEFLTGLIKKGFREKFEDNPEYSDEQVEEIRKDTKHELDVIKEKGFVEYILIVWDYINWANTHGCKTGPGRGSAAGSRVCYCIGITTVDPVKYNLLFERFLNPERVSMPDIDVDFEDKERSRVINDYIFKKYGEDHVSLITTFQNMKAKAVIKDVGRAMGIPYSVTNRVSKMIPNELNITLTEALQKSPDLKAASEESDESRRWFETAIELEGIPKSTGVHAAGVVIYPARADECMPQGRSKDGTPACEYNMIQLEQLGYLKMDFLGLRTLTVIKDAVKNIHASKGIDVDIDHIDLDDEKVLSFIGTGKTDGVFQLESSGMQSFMKELKPSHFEDIIAGISLYRPGPMDFIPDYIKGKKDPSAVVYKCRALEPILKDTYGCIVYQEQVMQIVQKLAGYSMGQADIVRRAMSKKHQDEIDAGRHTFVYGNDIPKGEKGYVPGCIKNHICGTDEESERVADEIYDSMIDFAKYAFNKSHAACYAVLSMQTAWLKYYYPAEYMAALLTSVEDNSNKMIDYLSAAREMGLKVLPPDVNTGVGDFSVEDGAIRFGLNAIKGIGPALVSEILGERNRGGKFVSYDDFLTRCLPAGLKKNHIENLVKSGACDCFGYHRREMYAGINSMVDDILKEQKESVSGQMSFMDLLGGDERKRFEHRVPTSPEFDRDMKLAFEKDVLGIYISGHPLEEYLPVIKKNVNLSSRDFRLNDETGTTAVRQNQRGIIAVVITEISVKYTKTNRAMAFVTGEDLSGPLEMIFFPDCYDKYRSVLSEDLKCLIKGHASVDDEKDATFIVDELIEFSDIPKEVWVRFNDRAAYDNSKKEIESLLGHIEEGHDSCIIYLAAEKQMKRLGKTVKSDGLFIDQLMKIAGEDNVSVSGGRV